jgi:hypothetical protein
VHQQLLQASTCHKTCCYRSNAIYLDRVAPPGARAPLPAQLVHVSQLREVSHLSHNTSLCYEICSACCLVAFARLDIVRGAGHPISCCMSCACRADACTAPGQVVRVHCQEAGGPLISGLECAATRTAAAPRKPWTPLRTATTAFVCYSGHMPPDMQQWLATSNDKLTILLPAGPESYPICNTVVKVIRTSICVNLVLAYIRSLSLRVTATSRSHDKLVHVAAALHNKQVDDKMHRCTCPAPVCNPGAMLSVVDLLTAFRPEVQLMTLQDSRSRSLHLRLLDVPTRNEPRCSPDSREHGSSTPHIPLLIGLRSIRG